jgi:hypothetical protein
VKKRSNIREPFCWQAKKALRYIRREFPTGEVTTALALYTVLTEHASDHGRGTGEGVFAQRQDLARMLGRSTDVLDRYLARFEALALVEREPVARENHYIGINLRLVHPEEWGEETGEGGSRVYADTPAACTQTPPPRVRVEGSRVDAETKEEEKDKEKVLETDGGHASHVRGPGERNESPGETSRDSVPGSPADVQNRTGAGRAQDATTGPGAGEGPRNGADARLAGKGRQAGPSKRLAEDSRKGGPGEDWGRATGEVGPRRRKGPEFGEGRELPKRVPAAVEQFIRLWEAAARKALSRPEYRATMPTGRDGKLVANIIKEFDEETVQEMISCIMLDWLALAAQKNWREPMPSYYHFYLARQDLAAAVAKGSGFVTPIHRWSAYGDTPKARARKGADPEDIFEPLNA